MMTNFKIPTRTRDYLLMGIITGIIAGILLIYIDGITYYSIIQASERIKMSFKMP